MNEYRKGLTEMNYIEKIRKSVARYEQSKEKAANIEEVARAVRKEADEVWEKLRIEKETLSSLLDVCVRYVKEKDIWIVYVDGEDILSFDLPVQNDIDANSIIRIATIRLNNKVFHGPSDLPWRMRIFLSGQQIKKAME